MYKFTFNNELPRAIERLTVDVSQFRLRHVEGVSVRCLENATRTCLSLERAVQPNNVESTGGKRAVLFRSGPHHVSSNPSWKLPSPIQLPDSGIVTHSST